MEQQVVFQPEEVIEDIKLFLPKLIHACDSVSKMLYQPINEDTWSYLADTIEGMDDLYRTLNVISQEMNVSNQSCALHEGINRTLSNFSDMFKQMNNCMDEEDYTGAADHIFYELKPLFEQLSLELVKRLVLRNSVIKPI